MTPPSLRRRAPLALLLCTVTLVPLAQGPTVQAADSAMGPGATLLVSGSRPPDGEDPEANGPAISDDGSTVAFQVSDYDSSDYYSYLSHIELRDVVTGVKTLVGNQELDSTAPSLSGDGHLVTYQTLAPGNSQYGASQYPGQLGDIDVYTTDVSGPKPLTRRITGTGTDLRYQRVLGCVPGYSEGEGFSPRDDDRCGPRLSGDGRSIAFPAQLSLVAPKLRFDLPDRSVERFDYSDHSLALVDFGSSTDRVLMVTLEGADPVHISDVVVRQGSAHYGVGPPVQGPPFCGGFTLKPNEGEDTCSVRIQMRGGDVCGSTQLGRIDFVSPTPRGQTSISLVGEDDSECFVDGPSFASLAAAPAGCPTPEIPSDSRLPGDPETQVQNLGQIELGDPQLVAQQLYNDDDGSDKTVGFVSHSCAMQQVFPDEENACTPGIVLDYNDSCTAYAVFDPKRVTAYAASFTLTGVNDTQPYQVVRVVGAGTEHVVVVRRDPQGTGRFTGTGRPPARAVSIDALGSRVDGVSPSLSADGRYVAFVSSHHGAFDGPRVLVHDTDRRGDRSYRSGETVLGSRLGPGADGLPDAAFQPSLSGNGRRLAFVTRTRSDDNTSSPTPAVSLSAAALSAEGVQVWVRDLARGSTVLASTPGSSDTGGSEASWSPSLSRDGSTVAFTSLAPELPPEGVELCCGGAVYVRDLGPDFGGKGRADPQIVSLPTWTESDGSSGQPAVDADGGVTAFTSRDFLLPESRSFNSQVYVRTRFGDPAVSPAQITFAPQQLNTTGTSRSVLVQNAGPGPVAVETASTGPFQITEPCVATLHRGESCRVGVAFAPTVTGPQRGRVTIRSTGLGWIGEVDVVGLAGTAVPPTFKLEPSTLTFPDTGIGQTSRTEELRLTNVGLLPLSSAALTLPGGEDFQAAVPPECVVLSPGATCTIEVTFSPSDLGARFGSVQVSATVEDVELTQVVPASGLTATPEISFSPSVAHEGRVTFVHGEDFSPGRLLTLTWSRGPVAVPIVIPDLDGSFTAPVLVVKGGGAGPRTLTVTMPGVSQPVEAAPLMVVQGSLQPPDFRIRN